VYLPGVASVLKNTSPEDDSSGEFHLNVIVMLLKRAAAAQLKVESGSGLSLSKCFRPAYKTFTQRRTLLSLVIVETIELIKSSIKMINCELFSHC